MMYPKLLVIRTGLIFLLCSASLLLPSCSAKQAEEDTPVARQQLDNVQADLEAAAQAAANRLQEACNEQNSDC